MNLEGLKTHAAAALLRLSGAAARAAYRLTQGAPKPRRAQPGPSQGPAPVPDTGAVLTDEALGMIAPDPEPEPEPESERPLVGSVEERLAKISGKL